MLLMLGMLICVFSCMCLYCCCGLYLLCSRIAAKGAPSMLVKPFADLSGHSSEEGASEIVRAGHEGQTAGGGHAQGVTTS